MQISLNADSGSRLHSALKRYVTEDHPLVKELYLNLGGLKTVRVLSYYPGTEGILTREFHFSIVPPVAEPDATVYFWRETSVADLLKRCVGLNIEPDEDETNKNWLEIFLRGGNGELTPIASMDLESEWGARLSFGNEYYYGLDGLGPGSWFKEAHYFVHALFRIVNTPESFLVHGACVGVDGKGVLICARGGGGKSTLSVLSMLRGFEYVSDDFLILERKGTRVDASPIYSFITLSPQMYEHMYDDLGKARFLGVSPWKGKYILDMSGYGDHFRSHYPIKALLFPEITLDAKCPGVFPCTPAEKGKAIVQMAHSTIVQNTMNGFKGSQRDSDFMRRAVQTLGGLPCYRIVLSPDIEANVECLRNFIKTQ